MSPFNLTSVCVMVTKYSSSPPLNWKLSFVWRQILISFWRKSHSDQAVVHPWESPEWSPWFAGIPLNWSSIGQLSKAARPVEKLARTLHGILSEKLNWTVSWDRLHTPAFTISHFIIGRKFGVRYVTSLVTMLLLWDFCWRLGGDRSGLVGGRHYSQAATVGLLSRVYWQAPHRRTVMDPRPVQLRTRTWAPSFLSE